MTYALPLSAAERWVNCPGSITLSATHPIDDASPKRAEGTAAAWVAAQVLHGVCVSAGQLAPNGVAVTAEMLDGADLYADAVRRVLAPEDMHVEEHMRAPSIHAEAMGDADVWGVEPDTNVLHVFEYKFGHRYVDEFENWQGAAYAIAAYDSLAYPDYKNEQTQLVEFTVVQPRYFGPRPQVRTWRTSMVELRGMRNQLAHAAEVAQRPDPPTRVGSYCRTCDARHACWTLLNSATAEAEYTGIATPFALDIHQASHELRLIEKASGILDARANALKIEITAALARGERSRHYQLSRTQPREAWKADSVDSILGAAALLGVTVAKPTALITPNQARKAGLPASLVDSATHRPLGELTLAPIDTNAARKAFGGNTQ